MQSQGKQPQRPPPIDLAAWRAYWAQLGQPWRTMPEIEPTVQSELAARRTTAVDIRRGIYPFNDIKLGRADIEWLIWVQQEELRTQGGSSQGRNKPVGLDLRGVDLRGEDLSGLPLVYLRGSLAEREELGASAEEREAAAIYLEEANLSNATLDGAILRDAHLEKANLNFASLRNAQLLRTHMKQTLALSAHFEQADLREADLEGIDLQGTHLEGADLTNAYMKKADLISSHLEAATLCLANLEGAFLSQAYLEGANLTGARLQKAQFKHAHLERATLGGVRLEQADLRQAGLAGASLRKAHLEGTTLSNAWLAGKRVAQQDLYRIQQWAKDFPAELPSADMRDAVCSVETKLDEAVLGDEDSGGVQVVDIRWGDSNLAVVDWSRVKVLGDEQKARQSLAGSQNPQSEQHLKAAVRANRQLSTALQGQGLNEEAAQFAYRAQVLQRHILLWKISQEKSYLWLRFLLFLIGFGLIFLAEKGLVAYFNGPQQPPDVQDAALELYLLFSFLVLGMIAVLSLLSSFRISKHQYQEPIWQIIMSSISLFFGFVGLLVPPIFIIPPLILVGRWTIVLAFILIPCFIFGVRQLIRECLQSWHKIARQHVGRSNRNIRTLSRMILRPLVITAFVAGGSFFLLKQQIEDLGFATVVLFALPMGVPYSCYELWRFILWIRHRVFSRGASPRKQRRLRDTLAIYGQYAFSLFLDMLAGYGYKPLRSLGWYVVVILGFATLYAAWGSSISPSLPWSEALVFSVTSFHGRGFFPGGSSLSDPKVVLAAAEAVIGLFIEISFIATFTQRYFGK